MRVIPLLLLTMQLSWIAPVLILGLLTILVGIALVFGNTSGAFVTFPFLGFIVGSVGGLILVDGLRRAAANDPALTHDEAMNYLRRRKARLSARIAIYILVLALGIGYFVGLYTGQFPSVTSPWVSALTIVAPIACLGLLRLEWRDYRVVARELARFKSPPAHS
jgi:hypothetical protein